MKKVVTYVILVFLFSSIFYFLLLQFKAHHLPKNISPLLLMGGLMWCPALAAIVTALVHEKNLKGFGWGWGKPRWQLLAYLLPLGYAALAYGLIWLAGWGSLNPAYKFNFISLVVFGTLLNVLLASGEEIGWRGFLIPQLYKLYGYTKACFITGIIWSLWHFPLIIGGLYLARMPLAAQLILFVITVTAMTFTISWFRLVSGSLWAAAILHASHNLYIQRLFDPLILPSRPFSVYLLGESGLVLTVIFIVLAVLFWRLRSKLPAPDSPNL